MIEKITFKGVFFFPDPPFLGVFLRPNLGEAPCWKYGTRCNALITLDFRDLPEGDLFLALGIVEVEATVDKLLRIAFHFFVPVLRPIVRLKI